jgi:hypothetical protein
MGNTTFIHGYEIFSLGLPSSTSSLRQATTCLLFTIKSNTHQDSGDLKSTLRARQTATFCCGERILREE